MFSLHLGELLHVHGLAREVVDHRPHDGQQNHQEDESGQGNLHVLHHSLVGVPGHRGVFGLGKLRGNNRHHIATAFLVAHHATNQVGEPLNLFLGVTIDRAGATILGREGLAVRALGGWLLIDDHRHRDARDPTLRILDVTNGLVDLIVAGGPLGERGVLLQGILGRRTRGQVGVGGGRRCVGDRARHALGVQALAAVFGQYFGACLGALLGGVEIFRGDLTLGEVQGDIHLRADIGFAQYRNEHLQNAGAVGLLHLLLVGELGGREAHGGVLFAVGEQVAQVVHHRDMLGGQIRHAGGHQMHNGVHLAGCHGATLVGAHDHRGLGQSTVAHEDTLLGQGQVHAGRLNGANLRNARSQFVLHGLDVLHLLHELAGGHRVLVAQRINAGGHRLLGNAFGGEINAGFVVLVARHHDLARGGVDLGIEGGHLQGLHGKLLVGLGDARHERALRRGWGLHHAVERQKEHQHKEGNEAWHRLLHRGLVQGIFHHLERGRVLHHRQALDRSFHTSHTTRNGCSGLAGRLCGGLCCCLGRVGRCTPTVGGAV